MDKSKTPGINVFASSAVHKTRTVNVTRSTQTKTTFY